MTYSVVIPAYNEEHRIERTLRAVVNYLAKLGQPAEVLVVDDGSRDGTVYLVEQLAEKLPTTIRLEVLPHIENRGKGAAVRTGCIAARGRYVLFSDADLATPIEEADHLFAALDAGSDIAIGSRIQPDGRDYRDSQPAYRRAVGWVYHSLVALFLVPGIADTQCGFKAFTASAAQRLFPQQTLDSIVFDTELLFLARQHGLRVAQIPVRWSNIGGSRMNVTLTHAFRVLKDLCVIRLRHASVKPKAAVPPQEAANAEKRQ